MKKLISLILACCLAASITPLFAEQTNLALNAESAILIDAESGAILYSKNIDTQHYPASITKIMTIYLALQNGKPEDVLTASKTAIDGIDRQSSHIALDYDEQISLLDASYAAMMASANDASNILAEAIGGTQEQFAAMMNEAATAAGAKNTHFSNAHGLPDETHVTTAYDMAMITRLAIKNSSFKEVFGRVTYEMPATNKQDGPRQFASGNEMLKKGKFFYEYATGGKIGWTEDAGYTMVTTAKKDNMELIAVVLKCSQKDARYSDTTTLFDYGFDNYKQIVVPASSFEGKTVDINKNGSLAAKATFKMDYDFKILVGINDDVTNYVPSVVVENEKDVDNIKAYAVLSKDAAELGRQEMTKQLEKFDTSFQSAVWPTIQKWIDILCAGIFVIFLSLFVLVMVARMTRKKK